MSKYTPGPWIYDAHDGAFYIFTAANLEMVADADPDDIGIARMRGVGRGVEDHEQEANARLIAAAPELLDSLIEITPPVPPEDAPCHRGMVSQLECGHCQRIMRAHARIKKAQAWEPSATFPENVTPPGAQNTEL